MTPEHRHADDAAPYVLGALEPEEAAAFERHLRECDECRDQVRALSVARDALPRSVEQVAPPPQLKASLMEAVRADARSVQAPKPVPRWRALILARPRLAGAVAAVAVAIGVGAGALLGAVGGDGDDLRTVAAVVDGTRAPAGQAELLLPDDGQGAQLRVEGMQQPQPGKVYEVWVKRGEQVRPSSLFTVDRDGNGVAAIPQDLRDADAVLVTREPDGGSDKPSEAPLVTVQVRS